MPDKQTRSTKPSFLFSAHCEIRVDRYRAPVLSVPAIDQGDRLKKKDLLSAGEVSADGKYTIEEHLRFVHARNAITPDQPLLVLGLRNNLVNLRCPMIVGGRAFSIEGEEPEKSKRPYYGLGAKNGRIVLDTALGPTGMAADWSEFHAAAVPVLWDDLNEDELLDLILCEAADHSHIYDLPRGKHPLATDRTCGAWQQLHDTFVQQLYVDRETATRAMRSELARLNPPLRRCDNYFHAIIGSREDGALVCLFAHGRLEHLGQILRERACRRAVCVENSGSVMPTFLPRGLEGDAIPLVRAPNFRPRGRAVLVLKLTGAAFDSIPITQETVEGQ